MLSQALRRVRYRALLSLLLLAAVLLAGRASATRIEYDIVSSQDPGAPPFSGLFVDRFGDDDGDNDDDDDDDDDDARGQQARLSDDLSGLLALSTDDPDLFLEDQKLRVDEFSLTGTAKLCDRCMEHAIEIALDPRFDSILELDDGALEGKIKMILTIEGAGKELTLFARGRTTDPESNFATPEFVSLLLALDLDEFDDFEEKGRGRFGFRTHGGFDDDDGRIFLQAQGPVVPEPGTFLLLGGGLFAMTLAAQHRRRSCRRTSSIVRRLGTGTRGASCRDCRLVSVDVSTLDLSDTEAREGR